MKRGRVMSLEFGVKSIKKITSSAFFFIICYLFLSINAYAATTYTVKNGDSLYKISKKFDISESELKKLNGLKNNKLKIGQKIRIRNDDRKTARKNLLKDKPKKETERTNAEKTYTVKKGDTVYRIAKRFDISVEELKELNELKNNSLKVGQTLIISEKMEEPVEPEDIIKSIQVQYDRKANPVVTSARLEEVKELSSSNDLSKMSVKERLMLFAKKMLHLPYKFGGNGAIGVDCSAYVQKVYGIAGVTIPRSAREQFRVGESVDKEELSIGDLVFFRTYASFPSHVGIYLGNNLFIHASSRSKKITIDSLESPYYFKRFIGAKRLIEEEEIKITEQSKDLKIPPITSQD